jgi:hypothetical protein
VLDALDPPKTDEQGRELPRRPLGERGADDDGLFGRILFAEPPAIEFKQQRGRAPLIIKPREMDLTHRYELLAALRSTSMSAINGSPRADRAKQGAAHIALLDLRDALLAAAERDGLLVEATEVPSDGPHVPSVLSDRVDEAPPASRSKRLVGIAVAVAAGAAVVLFSLLGGSQGVAKPVLISRLMAFNNSYGRKWGTNIRADPTDELTFQLSLANRGGAATPPLTAWAETKQYPRPPYGPEVRLDLARANGTIMTTSPWVVIRPWTNQIGAFMMGGQPVSLFSEPGGRRVRDVPINHGGLVPTSLRNTFDLVNNLQLGPIAGHQAIRLSFDASWATTKEESFGGLNPQIETLPLRRDEISSDTTAARPGDKLDVWLTLQNEGAYAADAHIKFTITPHDGSRYLTLTAFGIFFGQPAERLGSATVNSATGVPITLVPIPGTTWLTAPKWQPRCHAHVRPKLLPDGVALGGVDIGVFGGFIPHSNCYGTTFNREINFDAAVHPVS